MKIEILLFFFNLQKKCLLSKRNDQNCEVFQISTLQFCWEKQHLTTKSSSTPPYLTPSRYLTALYREENDNFGLFHLSSSKAYCGFLFQNALGTNEEIHTKPFNKNNVCALIINSLVSSLSSALLILEVTVCVMARYCGMYSGDTLEWSFMKCFGRHKGQTGNLMNSGTFLNL